jgi:hypothetical protein
VRKSDPQAAKLYSWMSPPRRSVRRSSRRGDAFTSRGVVAFGSGGVRLSDLCGLWPVVRDEDAEHLFEMSPAQD